MCIVSVILVNYNTKELIINAINSVFQKTENIEYEIIVVDNDSPDKSGQEICGYFGDQIKFIQLSKNIGFGGANNQALKIAQGKYIFLLNPDTLLVNNAIFFLANYLENNNKVGVCGGNLYDLDMHPMHSYLCFMPSIVTEINIFFNNYLFRLFYGRNYEFNYTGKPLKVGYITGADMMIRSDVLNTVGAFDEDFFMYFEETELTYRIRKEGYSIISVPNAEIIHLESKSFNCRYDKQKKILESRRIYYKKTHTNLEFFIANIVFVINCLVRLFIFKLLNKKSNIYFWLFMLKNL